MMRPAFTPDASTHHESEVFSDGDARAKSLPADGIVVGGCLACGASDTHCPGLDEIR